MHCVVRTCRLRYPAILEWILRYIAVQIFPRYPSLTTAWNFFATSHGKGPVDGVGGALKRAVRDMVCCRRAVVVDVQTFIAAYWLSSDCPATPGVKTCHSIYWTGGELTLSTTSTRTSTQSSTATSITPSPNSVIHKGNFVVVCVHGVKAGENYVAMVMSTGCDDISVVYLKRSGGKFFIVDTKEWLVDNIDIQRVLPQPSLDNRDRYDFGEIDI